MVNQSSDRVTKNIDNTIKFGEYFVEYFEKYERTAAPMFNCGKTVFAPLDILASLATLKRSEACGHHLNLWLHECNNSCVWRIVKSGRRRPWRSEDSGRPRTFWRSEGSDHPLI